MKLRQELHSLISNNSSDQLLTAIYSTESPLRNGFINFLGSSYADWISSNSQQNDKEDEIKTFKHAVEHTAAPNSNKSVSDKLTSINQKDRRKYFASFEKNPLQQFVRLYNDNSNISINQFCISNDTATKNLETNQQISDVNLLSFKQNQLWQSALPSLNDDEKTVKDKRKLSVNESNNTTKSEVKERRNDISDTKRKNLFLKKLQHCAIKFDFNTNNFLEVQAIKKKTEILSDIMKYMTNKSWYDANNANILPALFHLIRSNLFRSFTPNDECNHILWKQLQLVYSLTLKLVTEITIDKKKMLEHFQSDSFLYQLIQLFQSSDYRERNHLKTILHRIYGRFMPLRPMIRKHVAYYCYNIIYQEYTYLSAYGIAELLEIYCSIIHGLGCPVKNEHLQFCRNVLIPLHKCSRLELFHEQLVACCVHFILKDSSIGLMILGGLIRFWPVQSVTKQEMFIAEFVNIMNVMINHRNGFSWEDNKDVYLLFVDILMKCMKSENVNLAERAMFVWTEEVSEKLMDFDKELFWLKIVEAMVEINANHFCESVRECNMELWELFKEKDAKMFQKICDKYEYDQYRIVYAYICNVSNNCIFWNKQHIPNDIIVLCSIYYRTDLPIQ